MNGHEHGPGHGHEDAATPHSAHGAHGTVRPWQTLASLGITEDDLTTVRQAPLHGRQPEPARRSAALSAFDAVAFVRRSAGSGEVLDQRRPKRSSGSRSVAQSELAGFATYAR
ncbi:hypothetical protein ACWEKM_20170 [Streptomyces sp. NPDC004752]